MPKQYWLLIVALHVFFFMAIPTMAGEQVRAVGTFTNGITSGDVELVETAQGWFVRLGNDFHHDGSPDPWLALGKDGFDRSGIIGELKQFTGAQEFAIGPKLDPRDFNRVYVWCVEHNTSLGFAKLAW